MAQLTRRDFVVGAGAGLATLALPQRRALAQEFTLPEATLEALRTSPLVYVSPLLANGSESTCHGEVWFFWDEVTGSVAIGAGGDTWKSKAVHKRLDRARVWVGDLGRNQKGPDGPYREGPTFLARAGLDKNPETYKRLLAAFAKRYPDEWGKWKPRFQKGLADNSRHLLRYTPIGT